jgi:transcriptional regulator with XRE-family HTH domain
VDGFLVRTTFDLSVMVRARRLQLGWTQDDLAQKAHVSRRWVSMIERGSTEGAEFALICRLLRALGKGMLVIDAPDLPGGGREDTPSDGDEVLAAVLRGGSW